MVSWFGYWLIRFILSMLQALADLDGDKIIIYLYNVTVRYVSEHAWSCLPLF